MEADDLPGGIGVEGELAGDHLVENDACGVDIGPDVHTASLGLLGRHVVRGAHDHAGAGHGGEIGGSGNAEVGELGGSIGNDENILRLDVPVDDAVLMGALKPQADLIGDVDGAVDRELALSLNEAVEAQGKVLHRHEVSACLPRPPQRYG